MCLHLDRLNVYMISWKKRSLIAAWKSKKHSRNSRAKYFMLSILPMELCYDTGTYFNLVTMRLALFKCLFKDRATFCVWLFWVILKSWTFVVRYWFEDNVEWFYYYLQSGIGWKDYTWKKTERHLCDRWKTRWGPTESRSSWKGGTYQVSIFFQIMEILTYQVSMPLCQIDTL